MAALTEALAERPTGKAIMPLMLAKLRADMFNAAAADWVPGNVLEPQVEWQTRERNPKEDFFTDQKVETEDRGLWLGYGEGTMKDKRSMAGSAQTVLFRLPEGSWELDGIKLFSARYGEDEAPKEDISIYLCDENYGLLREIKVPYSSFEKGEEKWQRVSFNAVETTRTFYLGIDFHATATKGVYVGLDSSVKRSHSRMAMPYSQVSDLKETADWMICAHVRPKS
jgi:hypothetical protein